MSDFDLYESEIEDLYRPNEEPKVELTVYEAKTIEHLVELFSHQHLLFERELKIWKELRNRIKQAEGKCENE